ncbi:DNA/RNA polymerases superfamily protein [Gossypium australe]|uniref:DNA/RNA polymerases superfamily protein n=1 Tax=Gossypium australe TaxID=47621 RepID=A0A5B6UWI1_9ROSI|nr:DNA/RNA polymerases superfamily protein [Gossypium australe]
MAPYEALYGCRCRTPTCWSELGERQLLGPELISETEEKVKLIQDLKHKEIEYSVGDFVFLKVSPWKKILIFGRKGKLSPRFVGPYRVLKRVGPVAYQLELPPELNQIHNVFHVSMLRCYRSDPSHIVPVEEIEVRPDLTFEEEPSRCCGVITVQRKPRRSLRRQCDNNTLISYDQWRGLLEAGLKGNCVCFIDTSWPCGKLVVASLREKGERSSIPLASM